MNRRWLVTLERHYRDGRAPDLGEYPAQAETEKRAADQAICDALEHDDWNELLEVRFVGIVERFYSRHEPQGAA